MMRMIVFCTRDWLNPKAGAKERYVHEVFSRIAAQGHYVAWVAHHFPLLPWGRGRRPRMEVVDGIHIARLGLRPFYRKMAGLFLTRFVEGGKLDKTFDLLVDCVDGQPLPLAEHTGLPIMPLVFRLARGLKVEEEPPGPMIAASRRTRDGLLESGVPAKFVVCAPQGFTPVETDEPSESRDEQMAVVLDDKPKRMAARLRGTAGPHGPITFEFLGRRGPKQQSIGDAVYHGGLGAAERADFYRNALACVCGRGWEHEALQLGASGVPVLCPDTPEGREFVEHEATGLLYSPKDAAEPAASLRRLLEDEILRARLAKQAREDAGQRTWDRTAGLILAAMENLERARPQESLP